MKRLFTAISILFLTATLFAKDFIIPLFDNATDKTLKTLLSEYTYIYDSEKNIFRFNEDDLHFFNKDVQEVVFLPQSDDTYVYVVLLDEMNTSDWTNYILELVFLNGFTDYKYVDNEIVCYHEDEKYACMYQFKIMDPGNNKCVFIIRSAK